MAVKRVTIELDDYPNTERRTSAPPTLLAKEETLPGTTETTDVPSRQVEYQEAEAVKQSPAVSRTRETIGRTPADLVFAFVNRPEFMATALTFFAFLICVGKLQQVVDFWIPLLVAAVLNAVWFGVSGVRSRRTETSRAEGN